MPVSATLSNPEIVLPARSGSEAEGEAARALALRTGGERIGVVGDVGVWAPEAALTAIVAACAGATAAGWVPSAALGVACGAAAVLVAAQALGARLLDGLFPRSPTWSVVVGPLGPATPTIVVLPIDVPVPAITLARLLLGCAFLAAPWLPWTVALGISVVPAGLLLFRGAVPEVSGWYRQCVPVTRAAAVPLLLAGGSRRDARGVLGTLDWRRAARPAVLWVVGSGGGLAHLPRTGPWRWPRESQRWLLDPAVLRLWMRGMDVWVLGTSQSGGAALNASAGDDVGDTPLAGALKIALDRIDAARAMTGV